MAGMPVTRDPEDKRRRLLEAGLGEFSERGLGGARLDRIARRAQCSAGLLYSYFDSKEALFDSVFASLIARIVDEVPMTADDLPGYAVRLHSARRDNPVEARFLAWHELERGDAEGLPEVAEANRSKVAAIASAQREGLVDARLEPAEILAIVLAIAHGYAGPEESADAAIRLAVARVTGVGG
jgi:AcrR family transcriptional regulator